MKQRATTHLKFRYISILTNPLRIYTHIYFCIKNVINTNCISIDDPFLLNKKDSQGVIIAKKLFSSTWCWFIF